MKVLKIIKLLATVLLLAGQVIFYIAFYRLAQALDMITEQWLLSIGLGLAILGSLITALIYHSKPKEFD